MDSLYALNYHASIDKGSVSFLTDINTCHFYIFDTNSSDYSSWNFDTNIAFNVFSEQNTTLPRHSSIIYIRLGNNCVYLGLHFDFGRIVED